MARILFLSFFFMLPGFAAASASDATCPEFIMVAETLQSPTIDGWKMQVNDGRRYLVGVTFFDGDPDKQVSIVPTKDSQSGKERVAVWLFEHGDGAIWLACRYIDTRIQLTRRLAEKTRECRMNYVGAGIMKSLRCK